MEIVQIWQNLGKNASQITINKTPAKQRDIFR